MPYVRKLFEPLKLGNVELRNRLVMLSMGARQVQEELPDNRVKAFYAARAQGGVGLIIVGPVFPSPVAGDARALGIYRDDCIPHFGELNRILHSHGANTAAQLAIQYRWRKREQDDIEFIAPSPVYNGHLRLTPRALSIEEIEQIVTEFGEAARRAREAGFDSVEILASSGYLPSRFMSPLTNTRTDRYGGSEENRLRFTLEIIESIKSKAGEDFPIIARISVDDFMEGGNTLEDTKRIAPRLERAGIAAINAYAGWHESSVAIVQAAVPQGAFSYLAQEMKRVVKVPVIAAIRINHPQVAEQILAERRADLIGIARALLSDPEFANKAREGRWDDICPCIACCRCLDLYFADQAVRCFVNPLALRETEYAMQPAARAKKVLVIGGGPGGMQAATVAALRGHKVTLCDAGRRLGGAMLLGGILNREIPRLVKYMRRQVQKLPIDIKVGKEVTAAFVEKMRPDVVIIAVGGTALAPEVSGVNRANVLSGHDVLEAMIRPPRKGELGQRLLWRLSSFVLRYFYNPSLIRWSLRFRFPFKKTVVIIGGGFAGCEIADTLAQTGRKVTILEESQRIGYDIIPIERWAVRKRLRESGVRMETNVKVVEITDKGVKVRRDGSEEFFEGDTVVLAMGMKANRKLAQDLEGKVADVRLIGDCLEPRRVGDAIEEGYLAGLEV